MPHLKIAQTDWVVDGDTLRKGYHYTGLAGQDSEHVVQIDIDASPNPVMGGIHVVVSVLISPSLWGREDGYMPAQLASTDTLLETPVVLVRVCPADDGSLILSPNDREGTDVWLGALATGKELRLALFGTQDIVAAFPIPNDEQYRTAAESFFASMRRKHAAKPKMLSDLYNQLQPPPPSGILSRVAQKIFG